MKIQASRQLAVGSAIAWKALNDPEVLKQCIPGCEKFELTGEQTYAVVAAVRIGPVSCRFTGRVVLSDIVILKSYTLNFDAQGGVAGFGKGKSEVVLIDNDSGCVLQYSVESQVGGKLAQLGQRLLEGAAKSIADDFFKRFDQTLKLQAGVIEQKPTSARIALGGGIGWVCIGLILATVAVLALVN